MTVVVVAARPGSDREDVAIRLRRSPNDRLDQDFFELLERSRPPTNATPNNPDSGMILAIGEAGLEFPVRVAGCVECADGRCIGDWRTVCGGVASP